jgi:hypothetical protein
MDASDQPVFAGQAEGLPQVFAPSRAAEILRGLGLTGITECALKTRAYRKQVPYHRNGHRIIFTLSDLKEIAEGQAHRPAPRAKRRHAPARPDVPAQRRPPHRPHSRTRNVPTETTWRAKRTFND